MGARKKVRGSQISVTVRSDKGDNNSDGQVGEGGDITSSPSTPKRLKSSE